MAISFVGSGSGTVGTSNATYNFSSLLDAGGLTPTLQQNDLVVVSIGYRATVAYDQTPTGYSAAYSNIYENATSNDANLKTTYKFMGASPDATVTIPAASGSTSGSFVVHVFRGVNTTTPLDVTPTTAGAPNVTANPDSPSITPTTAGAWVYCVGHVTVSGGSGITNSASLSSTTNHFAAANNGLSETGAGIKTNWASGAFDAAAFGGQLSGASGGWAAASLVLRPAATAYTLTASAGSYALSGSTAGVLRGYKVAATAGSYALTGSALTARLTRRLSASAGSYALNGSVLTARAGRLLTASAGSYTLAGSSANTKAARSLAAAAGAYSESGSEATFKYGRVMAASAGSYALAGASVVFAKGYYLTAAAGAYALSGASAGLTAARLLSAGAGSYAVNGAAASFAKGFYLTASPGAYSLDGATAQLGRSFVLSVSVGAYTVAGSDAVLTKAGAVLIVALPARRTTHSSAMPGTASSRRITTYSSAKTGTGE